MNKRATLDLNELGLWLAEKWSQRLTESDSDYATVARQMRKQGIPLEIALAVLMPGKQSTSSADGSSRGGRT